ncbi:MAG: hypothetical protein MRJ65_14650 [Candidatus Brocadiaceae bacterium]|nr:hypothetical protein [Candidatus Brocadiaceae bacterium]
MATPNIDNLSNCVEDVRRAAIDGDPGPAAPIEYHALRGRLIGSQHRLPPLYREAVYQPYTRVLDQIGPEGFNQILLRDPNKEGTAGLMLDIAHTILQNGERYEELATDGFQEVVSDLYDGFLSEEDRRGVKLPDEGVIPPLVKWGNPHFGPYTFTIQATSIFDVEAPVVNMPPAHARRGLFAWAALGHETAGHDILHADTGLRAELAGKVRNALHGFAHQLDDYWADKIDETASDVLGILNMGPSAGIGLIGYFRGLQAAFNGAPKLRNSGGRFTVHPVDILRGFLAASTVRLLSFQEAESWSNTIENETRNDLEQILIGGESIDVQTAVDSARIVAETIVTERLNSLENHALGEIQDWADHDEEIVSNLSEMFTKTGTVPQELVSGAYAAHVVAAAVSAALKSEAEILLVFGRMLSILKPMHDSNPSWGPLFVSHPGNIYRHGIYE